MSTPVSVQRVSSIAVLTVDHPPVNALSPSVRCAFMETLDGLEADPQVQAIVVAARGKSFARSDDIGVLGTGAEAGRGDDPDLAALCGRIEASEKPVVAALHGAVMGGGLELALACHYRIADRRASFGMPEITLGLCASGGATQRLPRLIGPTAAAEMMLTGRRVTVQSARTAGLVDHVADGPLPAFTMKTVSKLLRQAKLPARPTRRISNRLKPGEAHMKALSEKRPAAAAAPVPAGARILDCIEATMILPFEAGLGFERAVFEDLLATRESRALRHAYLAERLAQQAPLDRPAAPRRIERIGVVGAGLMGTGIAAASLDAGFPVTLVDVSLDRLEAGVENVIDIYERKLARNRIDAATRDARIARLNGQTSLSALSGADLVIDATTEDAEVKRRVFAELDAVMKREAILATATSGIDIDGLAAGTGRAEQVLGLHFFPPAHVVRLCEVVMAVDSADDVIATAFQFLRQLGKQPVACGVSEGYVAGRVQGACVAACELMLATGTAPEDIDKAMRDGGFSMGPLEMADLAGLEIDLARRARFAPHAPGITERLIELGRTGRRVGRGFFAYAPQARSGAPDPEVDRVLLELRALGGTAAQALSADEIRRRCLAAMANEGARLIEEGIALRPSDIDVAMIAGFGFPRYRGGPMMAADLTGLVRIKRDLDRFAEADPSGFWTVTPLIADLVRDGRTFGDLNDGSRTDAQP